LAHILEQNSDLSCTLDQNNGLPHAFEQNIGLPLVLWSKIVACPLYFNSHQTTSSLLLEQTSQVLPFTQRKNRGCDELHLIGAQPAHTQIGSVHRSKNNCRLSRKHIRGPTNYGGILRLYR